MSGPFGEIITFYSYKGGTGRSMVLANVGHILTASESYGRARVLLIDWDLEAPGLERFFGISPSARPPGPGLIDYLTDMAAHYRREAPLGRLPESMARDELAVKIFNQGAERYPLKKYYGNPRGSPRNLCLMQAGRRGPSEQDTYSKKVRAFDWGSFYRDYGSFFTHFRERLMAEFDYVLIDSRTGLTDIGGICTRVMPEKLILVFAPNHQNIDGVLRVAEKSIGYRVDSRDPRALTVFPVASRIDGSDSLQRTTWRSGGQTRGERIRGYQPTFEEFLRKAYQLDRCDLDEYFNHTQIPHDGAYAYGEAIAAAINGTEDPLGIGRPCAQLAQRLVHGIAPWESPDEPRAEFRGTVYISYRRADSRAAAALYDGLTARLGPDRVFLDVSSVGVGQAWLQAFAAHLETASAVIVLIGTSWVTAAPREGTAPQETGDFVYEEIAAALRRDVPVIPVLLDEAAMPSGSELPRSVRALADRQAIVLHTSRWGRDVERLAAALESLAAPAVPPAAARTEQAEPRQAVRPSAGARIAAWFRSVFGSPRS